MTLIRSIAAAILVVAAMTAAASAQSGPVATACAADIAKACAGKAHDGEVRVCLETNYDKLAAACKAALDTTGGGRGKGLGKAK